jgi:DNA-binding NarL/FixJ family response regulator
MPVTVEGVRRALATVGVEQMAILDHPLSGQPPVEDLDGVVLFADTYHWVEVIRMLRARYADLPLIALISGTVSCHEVLSAGVSSVTRCDSPVEVIAQVIHSCLVGQPVLATDLARELMEPPSVSPPSAEESSLLLLLADGVNMRTLAERSGYSERHVYRVLKRLYERLGVATKEAAVELARERGWLRPRGAESRCVRGTVWTDITAAG